METHNGVKPRFTHGLLLVLLAVGCSESGADIARRQQELNGALANWNAEGPTTLTNGQTENLPGNDPVIGALHAVVAHPTDADVLYVGAVNGGVWRTENATSASPTWVPLTDFQTTLSIGALAMDPADSNVLLAGLGASSSFSGVSGALDGLLLTADSGASWTPISPALLRGRNISGAYLSGQLMLVSARDGSGGVFRSSDGGVGWARISSVPTGPAFDLAVDPSNPARFYVTCGGNGLYMSDDSGQTFTDVAANDPTGLQAAIRRGGVSNAELGVGDDGRVFTVVMLNGQASYIGHSSDQGATWTAMDLPRFPQTAPLAINGASNTTPIVVTTAAPHGLPINNGNVRVRLTGVLGNTAANGDFAVIPVQPGDPPNQFTLAGSAGNGAYTSGGAWQRWAQLNPRVKPGGQGGIHLSVVVDPNDSNFVFVGGDRQDFPNAIGAGDFSGNLVRGDASVGATGAIPSPQWAHITHSNAIAAIPLGGTANSTAPHADSRDMTFDANGDLIEVDDGGIYRRSSPGDNTGDWSSLNGNLTTTEFHSIAYDPVSGVVIGGAQDNGNPQQNSSGGGAWTAFTTADGGDVQVDSVTLAGQSIRYTSTQNLGGFSRTVFDASGAVVTGPTSINPTPPMGVTATAQFVTPFELNAQNAQRMVIGYQEAVFESSNQGSTIASLGAAGNATGMAYGHPTNAELLWVAAPGGLFLRTTAGGALSAVAFPGGTPTDVVIDPDDAATAYVITNTRLFVTRDTGASWTEITGDLTQLDTGTLRQVTYVPSTTVDRVAVATNGGVFVMAENAVGFWNELGHNTLPNALVFDLDYDASADFLVVGTMGRGAWSLTPASTVDLPPAAICQDVIAEADAQCLGAVTAVELDDGSLDPEGGALTFTADPVSPYELGLTSVTLNVSDAAGATEQCQATVTVVDVTPPVLPALPANIATLCNASEEELSLEVPEATDNCDPNPVVVGVVIASDNPSLTLPLVLGEDGAGVVGYGTHTVRWTATDFAGNSSFVDQVVSVRPALYVSRKFDLRDRSRLLAASGGLAAIANTGTTTSYVGVEADVGELVSRSQVRLFDRSLVGGNIYSSQNVIVGNQVVIEGNVFANLSPLPLPLAPPLPTYVVPVGPGTSRTLEPDRSASLAPGRYGDVVVKSRSVLFIRSGLYVLNKLAVEPQARIQVDLSAGPVTLVVNNNLEVQRANFVTTGGSSNDLTLIYLGTNAITFEFPWSGVLFAPLAGVTLGSGSGLVFRGRFSVRDFELRPDVSFFCE